MEVILNENYASQSHGAISQATSRLVRPDGLNLARGAGIGPDLYQPAHTEFTGRLARGRPQLPGGDKRKH
jgi:hypothetical protein